MRQMAIVREEGEPEYNGDVRREILRERRLVLASNRGPVSYTLADGVLRATRGAGGLVTALAALSQYTHVTWVCAAMSEGDRLAAIIPDLVLQRRMLG